MKKLALVGLLALAACGMVTVKEGNKECMTATIGLLGFSIGGPLSNGCK